MELENVNFSLPLNQCPSSIILEVQECLEKGGYLTPNSIDGIVGPMTLAAFKQFKRDSFLAQETILGAGTAQALLKLKSKVPDAAINLIKEFEGCYLNAYPDPLSGDKPITIGFGSTKKLTGDDWNIGECITEQESLQLLQYQLKHDYIPTLQRTIPFWNEMNDNQRSALISFAYNLGKHFFGSPEFKTITKVLKEKSWDKVPSALFLYHNPGTNVAEGLKRRRLSEGKLWNTKS